MVIDIMQAFRGDHRYRARVGRETALHVQRLPRAVSLVLGHAVAVLRRRAEGRHITGPRNSAADIDEREPDCASYGRVALPSRPERVVSRVDVELFRYRTVDDDKRRAQVGRGLQRIKLNGSSHIASIASMISGKYSGRHPAITAFAASRSGVASP